MKYYCPYCKSKMDPNEDHIYMMKNLYRCGSCGKLCRKKVSFWYFPLLITLGTLASYCPNWLVCLPLVFIGVAIFLYIWNKMPFVPFNLFQDIESEDDVGQGRRGDGS